MALPNSPEFGSAFLVEAVIYWFYVNRWGRVKIE